MKLPFTKMHGLGNDFVVIDFRSSSSSQPTPAPESNAKLICDRRLGIGADQILILRPSKVADFKMDILNADGSVAEMCGNGIRAVALFAAKRAQNPQSRYRIETLAGIKTVEIHGDQVRVDMGAPALGDPASGIFMEDGETLAVAGQRMVFYEVSMGNPHAVIFEPDFAIETLGPAIEKHPRFPARTNVEFVRVEASDSIRVRVWERGAGLTLACGTGACAAAVAAIATGRAKSPVTVHLPGGALKIEWDGRGSVFMEGPAMEVFSGEISLPANPPI